MEDSAKPAAVDASPVTSAPATPVTPVTPVNKAPEAKKSNAGKIIAIVLGVLVLIALCCGVILFLIGQAAQNTANDLKNAAKDLQSSLPYASSLPLSTASNSSVTVSSAAVGTRKVAGDFAYTVTSVKKDNNNYIIEVKVENLISNPATFSTLLQMKLTGDSDSDYSQNFMYDVGESRLDGSVPAKGSVTGKIVYSVDDNPSKLTLTITAGFLSKATPAVFVIK